MKGRRQKRIRLTVGISIALLLTAAVIALGGRMPFYPHDSTALAIFFALECLIVGTFGVFVMIFARTLLRLRSDRGGGLTSRFKTKMVIGATGVSLLPIIFMAFFSYALLNHTLNLWFPRPLEVANSQSQALLDELVASGQVRRTQQARASCDVVAKKGATPENVIRAVAPDEDTIWFYAAHGQKPNFANAAFFGDINGLRLAQTLPNGAEIWTGSRGTYIGGSTPCLGGTIVVAKMVPSDFLQKYTEIQSQTATYNQQRENLAQYKRTILTGLGLITLLLLFATTWVALFLAKQVTVPIQALVDGTTEIAHGNFAHRISLFAKDELGTLIRSFNKMTEQLGEGRRQINEFTTSLETAIEEGERRRKLMETILENIPTGVVSLNEAGEVVRVNSAAARILGDYARNAPTLEDLLGDEAARAVMHLMRRSLRMGAASREIEIATGGKLVRAAVTVSSLGPRRSNPGFIVSIDDLTELLRAQRAAAWQEVAQRIAHEIKNPLTPIQLSAQRMLRYLERHSANRGEQASTEFEAMAAQCAGLIEREVQTLESLVEEFSQFARFPSARLAPADVNAVVGSAVQLFEGRLDGVTIRTEYERDLPPVKADEELMRRVLANLIDNAAEAMEGATVRILSVATHVRSDGDAVEIVVADSGHGISPKDKERLFLPHFSTKERGTGLGLAIASRIVAEHNGTIRVEDNQPTGTRFVIRFPSMEKREPEGAQEASEMGEKRFS
ncbi:MAG TPA: ATP-binding protein [Candidatus Acidoferrales bacterium]|nr:ATP-binding protein [Candidatus Acidoferrales bacterium]